MPFDDRAVPRRFFAIALAGLVVGFSLCTPWSQVPAYAEAHYPDRPVRVVLPFAAGGLADITARIVADKLSNKLGQRFYVENQAGAGGITAARTVTSSPPDGYTLALFSNGTAISVSLFEKLPFDPVKDFAPISSLGFFDFLFCTGGNSKFKTLADFAAAAKAKPGALNVGTINVGGTQNLSAELFKTAAGIDFTIVPYKTTPEILVALMQGNIDLMVEGYSTVKGNLADGKFRILASSGPVRSESTPDIATVQESGFASYDVVSWNALFARAGTPPQIITTLNNALREILADPDVKQRLIELGIEARASTPQEIEDRLTSDIEKWRKVIEKAGIPKQ